jgi:mannan endo-1,4-beta-mannosidase
VDIIAMDEYNWGTSQSWSKWADFKELYWKFYSELTHLYPDKPLMIGEFSASHVGGDKAKWIEETFHEIRTNYPQIKAFIWFNQDNREGKVNNIAEGSNWMIDSNPGTADSIKRSMENPYFIDRISKK